jgi:hypothetical protein
MFLYIICSVIFYAFRIHITTKSAYAKLKLYVVIKVLELIFTVAYIHGKMYACVVMSLCIYINSQKLQDI